MAKITPTAAPAIANVSTARMTGTSPVSGHGRVEELSGSNALSFEAAQFGFQNAPDNQLDDRRTLSDDRRRNPNLGRGRFTAPNETFAQIIQSEISAPKTSGDEGRPRNFAGLVSKAIATYELNAQVIHGTLPRKGTTLSMRL
ncbi:MAG: hypothetical protein COW30_11870 [Rhodospirillales bacterium CG15_BIG_FIL_POST_REV_8_21_14_020_66_15]|nr:MAG: hypothetical protein COW30_11870 [Rhodospirillales bacterium CG15_BIG_FIL_POST_REV_8_21_14_020_66_15]